MRRDLLILEAAERLFYEHGYDGIGVDAIGEEAGISGSAIYRHFSGKDEILATLFDRAIDVLIANVGTPLDHPDEELEHLISVHLGFSLEHPRLAAIWANEQGSIAPAYLKRIQRRQREYLDRWNDCLQRCYPRRTAGELRTARRAVLALLMSSDAKDTARRGAAHRESILTSMALASLSALELQHVAAR